MTAEFDWRKKNFLVVHWGDAVRQWLVSILRKRNPGLVVAASRLDEVPKLMRQFRIDAILLELPPQDVNHIKFLRALRVGKTSPNPSMPVFAVLQTDNHPLIQKACEYGLSGVFVLPVSERAIVDGIVAAHTTHRYVIWTKNYVGPERRDEAAAESYPGVNRRVANTAVGGRLPAKAASAAGAGLDVAGVPAKPAAKAGWDEDPAPPPAARAKAQDAERGFEMPDAEPVKKKRLAPLEEAPPAHVAKPGSLGTWGDEDLPLAEPDKREDLGDLPEHVRLAIEGHQRWAESRGRDGARGILRGVDLAGLDLSNLELSGMDLRDSDLSDCNLSGSRLSGADMRYAVLEGADLTESNLAVAKLRHARLRQAKLVSANLRGADLSGADLRNTQVADTDFGNAITLSADVRGTDLSGAETLYQSQADRMVTDDKTRLPPGVYRNVETVED